MAGEGGALRELLAIFSFGVDTEELKKGETALEHLKEKLKHVAEAVLAAFAVEQIYEFVESNVKAMTAIEHTAAALNISTEKVQEFQFAAHSMGMEAESMLNLMGRLQVSQQAAAKGAGQQAQAFKKLGVNVRDQNGQMKSADELFLDVADGIAQQTDASLQAALATELFGRQGRVLLPLLKQGRKGVEDLTDGFKELGGGYDELTMKKGKEFEKQQARMRLALTSFKNQVVGVFLPPATWIINKIGLAVNWFRKFTEGTHVVQIAVVALGAALVAMAAPVIAAIMPMIAPFLILGAIIAGLVLIVDDLIGLFEGKDSLIGRWIDEIFGKGASTDLVKELRDVWKEISEWLKETVGWIKEFVGYIKDSAIYQFLDKANEFRNAISPTGILKRAGKAYQAVKSASEKNINGDTGDIATGAFITGEKTAFATGLPAPTWEGGGGNAAIPNFSVAPTINITVPPGTANPDNYGRRVAAPVAEEIKRHTRAAAANIQRGSSP